VTGTDGLASHSATVSLTVAANDFSISASPASLSITAGSSGSVTLSTSAINGVGSISLSAAGQPAGVTATFSPASINAGSSTTLTLATSAFAVAGSYTVTVTGTEGSISHTAVIALTVKSAFPQASILDTFNRANGRVGTSWTGLTDSSFYRINGNRLDVQIGGPLVWQPTLFGANQEAFITLSTIDPASASQGLLLKVQGSSIPNGGAIVVVYDATAKAVRVKTLRLNTQTWTVYTGQAATFANGDQLGARALANGTVLIYKNGNLIAIVTLSTADQTFFNSKGGRIGLWTVNAPNAFFDNFGGGSVTLP
jgi:hypothetical protein